jgi:Transglutaminase-like superfamily
MSRGALATLILLTWVGALGWLGIREFGTRPTTTLDDTNRTVPPGSNFYRVTMGGAQIGYASSTVDTVPDGLVVEDRLVLEVPALGEFHRTETHTLARLTNTLRLREFEAGMASEVGRFLARGTVSGDTLLSVEIESANSTQHLNVPLDEPIVLPAYLPLRLAFGADLEVGQTYAMSTFDPLLLQQRKVDIRILAESTLVYSDSAVLDSVTSQWTPASWDTVHAWRVEQSVNGIGIEAWIDDLGRIMSAESGIGFGMERAAFEIAYNNFRDRDRTAALSSLASGDIIRETAIAANADLSRGHVSQLDVVLRGADLEGFDLDGGRQRLSGDTLRIRQEDGVATTARYRLPRRRADEAYQKVVAEFEPLLRAEPLIQSDDPRIQAQARQIAGGTRDPHRVVEQLNDWVYDHLDKQITISVPSAVEVLETKRGDCNEHTILFVAMARAMGIPARTAAGLAYVNGSFYYHAWPEVYLGDWVAVDPTFGQFPADAAHLRFTVGGLARQVELIRLIGRLDLDIIGSSE